MKSKLKFKIELEYFLEDKKIIFCNETCNDGLSTKSISVGENKIIEKTINSRILSGECLLDGIRFGYAYIYDENGLTIDLKQLNENISINESVNKINETKKSNAFSKAEMNGLLTITNSPEFISTPSKNFIVYKEITLDDDKNTYSYLIKKTFVCAGKLSKIESYEEKYQINNDYVILITDLKTKNKRGHCKIGTSEIEISPQNLNSQKEIQSFIDKLTPLKELSDSHLKDFKNVKIEVQKSNENKANR